MDPIVCSNSLPYVVNSEQSIGRGIFTNKDRYQESKGNSAPNAQDRFKGESETQKMSNLKDFGGHAMNWNIEVEF